jgi:crotonobetainyl-CoA:carnitine CoA-transferase CaiB-like acyl-CoA transferase
MVKKFHDVRMGTLDGIRVIEAGTMITAPLAAMILGDQGADVIKLEPPGVGDPCDTSVHVAKA